MGRSFLIDLPNMADFAIMRNLNEVNQFIEDTYEYFYPPEDPDHYRTDTDDDHDLVTDIDSDTLIRIVKFLK